MESVQRARSVLENAETSLRQIAAETLDSKRYAEVAEIARMADGLSALLGLSFIHPTSGQPTSPVGRVADDGDVGPLCRVPRKVAGAPRARKGRYPRFVRDACRLVKIGWSKKKRQEYEHRSAKDSVMTVVKGLAARQIRRSPFRIDEVMPMRAVDTKFDVPAYVIYMTVAWLQQGGAIRKRGREGYAISSNADLCRTAEELWDTTPIAVDASK